ncbi:MAG: DNA polymerase IV [bacterium]
MKTRKIIHVDMDAFFASIEQRDNPELRGKPVIVGADPKQGRGRGVVSAASYEARAFGIRSAMPISKAYRLCPQGCFVSVHSRRYAEVSRKIMALFREYTPLVEPISLDEAFLDVTGTGRLKGKPESIGREIKSRIKSEEKLTASVGIAPNKLTAKIASDLEKPDGFVVVKSGKIKQFLSPLPIRRLWGIGRKTEERMMALGIETIGDFAGLSEEDVMSVFGNNGTDLWRHAQGLDSRQVKNQRDVKSISNERTFLKDETDPEAINDTLLRLSEKVGFRLRKNKYYGKSIFLKVRLSDFTTLVRHSTLSEPINLSETIFREVKFLYEKLEVVGQPIRLLGVGISQLCPDRENQLSLFDFEDKRRQKAAAAVDLLKKRFGDRVIGRGLY